MTTLIKYHTVQANPEYYWENNQVATKLKNKELLTYADYEKACKLAGCNCYNQERFEAHLKSE